jgi:hypothetical protein
MTSTLRSDEPLGPPLRFSQELDCLMSTISGNHERCE